MNTVKSPIAQVTSADYEVDLCAIASHPISISDVGQSLTPDQKFFILRRLNFQGLLSLDDLPPEVSFMIEKIEAMTVEEAVEILAKNIPEFKDDPNYLDEDRELVERLLSYRESQSARLGEAFKEKGAVVEKEVDSAGKNDFSASDESLHTDDIDSSHLVITDWPLQVRLEASLFEYWSPYPQVRACMDPFDDPSIPCETFRVYFVGIIWCAIGSVINQFFSERFPSISLPSSVTQVFIYPSGVLCTYIFPKWKFKIWKYTIDLNPGPWSPKEQMLCTLSYSVCASYPYSVSNILIQKLPHFYNNEWTSWGYQILLTLSTQFMGFGFAGIVRRFAVYPAHTVWPTLLPTLALNKALISPEKRRNINGWTVSKYKFFFSVFAISFLYFWIPDYLFQALSTFNWLAWIKPDNLDLANITGSQSGLGLNPFPSFDWNVVGTGAMYIPFFNTVSNYVGMLLGFVCIVGLYYSNYRWSGFIPINTNRLYGNTGKPYNVRAILNKETLFDDEKYQKIGPPYYSAANLVTYGAFFALYPFAFVYEILTNYRIMWKSLRSLGKGLINIHRSSYEDFDDPNCRMMSKYPEVPEWAYTIVMIISLVLAILTIKLYPTETPVWGIFFAIGMNFVFIIPMVALYSVTGFSYALNVLIELIVGYAIPGNGIALSIIKSYGTQLDSQAENYITNQKIAHYAKIPPRPVFRIQMLTTFINVFVCLGILNYQITNMEGYCLPGQPQKLTCPGATTFFSASVIWGVIGPKRVFNGLYPILKWCFLIGFLLALVCAAIKLLAPRRFAKMFHPTIIIGGMMNYAPYNLSYYTGGLYIGWAFMVYIRKRFPAWWEKYTFILACAIPAGIAFSSIIIFFSVQYHPKDISWWGNNVNSNGWDYYGGARLNATEQPGGYFGVRQGHYP